MRNLYTKVDKSLIPSMPRDTFEGKIIVIQSESEAIKAINALSKENIVGIDTETKPAFKKGVVHKVALLQIATSQICFLFRLNYIGLIEPIIKFLGNSNILKVGLSLHNDIVALHRREDFKSDSFLDLQDYVKLFGIEDCSLQKIYANVFGKRISKAQRLSDWEADVLNDKQKKYAATDAWACLMIYNELKSLNENHDYNLINTGNGIQENNP